MVGVQLVAALLPLAFAVALADYRHTCCYTPSGISLAGRFAPWFYGYKNVRYSIYDCPLPWDEAEAVCKEAGGYLVSINSAKEQDWIVDIIESHYGTLGFGFWIGLKRIGFGRDGECGRVPGNPSGYHDDTYRWSDGTYVFGDNAYSNWEYIDSQPNCAYGQDVEKCIMLVSWTDLWNDAECGNRYKFICELPRGGGGGGNNSGGGGGSSSRVNSREQSSFVG